MYILRNSVIIAFLQNTAFFSRKQKFNKNLLRNHHELFKAVTLVCGKEIHLKYI